MTTASTPILARAGGRAVLVLRPAAAPGLGSVEMLCTLARARAESAAACFLPPEGEVGELVAAATATDVPMVGAGGWRGWQLNTAWRAAAVSRRTRARSRRLAAAMLSELYRELRRHAGNERFPMDWRRRLRESAHRCYDRSTRLAGEVSPYPRRLLREPSTFALPDAELDRARDEARASGVPGDARLVAFEVRSRPDVAAVAARFLHDAGYTVVRVGDGTVGPVRAEGLVDLTVRATRSVRLDLFVLCAARFLVCESAEWQQLAYLTNTPSLVVNAVDPFAAYPIRANGVFALRSAVDLESGRVLALDERLSERYLRNTRAWGYRGISGPELVAAIGEMTAGIEQGWTDSTGQARFRQRAAEAGRDLAGHLPAIAAWAPDAGFIGDGRLARFQADAA